MSRPPRDLITAAEACTALAADLPYGLLRPETLTWKLASQVMLAAAGAVPRQDHAFTREELPDLFEQLVMQMQELPSPPPHYRAQIDEPALVSEASVRILAGLSGAGKTAWVAEAATHAVRPVTYLDVVETPGPALASAVAREVAARMFGRSGGRLGEIVLPGSSGLDTLGALSVKLGDEGLPQVQRETVGVLSFADVPLSRDEASSFLEGALDIDARVVGGAGAGAVWRRARL